jgi:hypothetical protein
VVGVQVVVRGRGGRGQGSGCRGVVVGVVVVRVQVVVVGVVVVVCRVHNLTLRRFVSCRVHCLSITQVGVPCFPVGKPRREHSTDLHYCS